LDGEPPAESLPDASAMVARLRRLREQRQREEPQPRPAPFRDNGSGEARFHPGDRIVCMPFGKGEVRESRLEAERELLLVQFDEHGEVMVDTAVNAVRLDESDAPAEDDEPF
jgi:hypothetical protein